jgi:hypothetical protein
MTQNVKDRIKELVKNHSRVVRRDLIKDTLEELRSDNVDRELIIYIIVYLEGLFRDSYDSILDIDISKIVIDNDVAEKYVDDEIAFQSECEVDSYDEASTIDILTYVFNLNDGNYFDLLSEAICRSGMVSNFISFFEKVLGNMESKNIESIDLEETWLNELELY